MSDWFVQTGTGGGAQHEYVWTQTSGVVSYLVFMVSELSNKCLHYVLCGWFSDVLPPLRLFVLLSARAELLMYASPR